MTRLLPLALALIPCVAATLPAQTPAPGFEPEVPSGYALPDGTVLPTRDLRALGADPSDDPWVIDPEAFAEMDRFWSLAVVRRNLERGADLYDPLLQQLSARALNGPADVLPSTPARIPEPPPPGGVGYGTIYDEPALRWNESTACHQLMVAPRRPGGDVTTWLYSTMTNRSNLGVEAFVSYFSQSNFAFTVYDWARAATDPWQVSIDYSNVKQYLQSVQCPDGVWRQEIYVINETVKVADNTWTNRVWLLNRKQLTLDLMYQYTYATVLASENTYENGDVIGWWGPIFETFQDHDGSQKAIGWNDSFLVQDDVVKTFTNSNTSIRIDDLDLTPPIFRVSNHCWAVGSTAYEPSVTMREAESGRHGVGEDAGDGWLAGPAHGPGKMLKGPPFRRVPGGDFTAEFRFKVEDLVGSSGTLVRFGVFDLTTRTVVQDQDLELDDFKFPGTYQRFRTNFVADDDHHYILGCISNGLHDVTIDKVILTVN